MKNSLYLVIIMTIPNISFSQALQSGYYDGGLAICYNSKDNNYKCYVEDYRYNSEYSCAAFFILKLGAIDYFSLSEAGYKQDANNGGSYTIISPGMIQLKFNKALPECRNASPINFEKNNTFNLINSKKWIDIFFIKSSKCVLYLTKENNSKKKGYIVKDEVVKVIKSENSWLYIEYENFMSKNHKPLFAWIHKSDCY